MNYKSFITSLLAISFLLSFAACTTDTVPTTEPEDKDIVEAYDFAGPVVIDFGADATEASISNPLSNEGVTIIRDGNDIDIHSIKDLVEYQLTGTTTNGSVRFYSENKFQVSLDGVEIQSDKKPALNIQSSKRAYIVAESGTANIIADTGYYPAKKMAIDENGNPTNNGMDSDGSTPTDDGEDKKGAFFSEGQLVFSGSGTITVKGRNKHAIASDEYVRIREGAITVTDAISDAIHPREYFIFETGSLDLTASREGIQVKEGYVDIAGGNINIISGDDGIVANYGLDTTEPIIDSIRSYIQIDGGTVNLNCTANGSKAIGIMSTDSIYFYGGSTEVLSSNGGIGASSTLGRAAIVIDGGTYTGSIID